MLAIRTCIVNSYTLSCISRFLTFYLLDARSCSNSYFTILVSVCLFVGLSKQGLGRLWKELMAAAMLDVAGLFATSLQNGNASTIDSRGTALDTRAQYRESSPRSTGMARNQRQLQTSQGHKLHWCYSTLCTLCPISKLHDPQSQLECISPRVALQRT